MYRRYERIVECRSKGNAADILTVSNAIARFAVELKRAVLMSRYAATNSPLDGLVGQIGRVRDAQVAAILRATEAML
jgi:hypothetical protein